MLRSAARDLRLVRDRGWGVLNPIRAQNGHGIDIREHVVDSRKLWPWITGNWLGQ